MMTSSNGNVFRVTGFCEGNPPVTGGFPSQRPVKRSFDVFFDPRLNKRISKQSRRRRFETSSYSLWCHCNGITYLGPWQSCGCTDASESTLKNMDNWSHWAIRIHTLMPEKIPHPHMQRTLQKYIFQNKNIGTGSNSLELATVWFCNPRT